MLMGQENLIAVDTNAARLTDARAQVNNLRTYSSVERALEDKPQAAIIATPPATHSKIAISLLYAGIPILIEKPLAHTLFDGQAIKAAAYIHNTLACVGYSMRFHPAIQLIRDELLPEIGKPLYARAEVGQYLPDWHKDEDITNWYMRYADQGGGALLDLSHEIDYLRTLFGGWCFEPRGTVCTLSRLTHNADDFADFLLNFNNNVVASIHMDLLDRSYNRRLRIVGSDRSIEWNDATGFLGFSDSNAIYGYNRDRNVQFEEEIKAFIESVQTKTLHTNLATIDDGIEVLKVVEELRACR